MSIKTKTRKNLKILLVLGLFIVVILGALNLAGDKKLPQTGFSLTKSQVEKYVDEVIKKCEDEQHRPTCYEEEIPKLMDRITLEDAFSVTRVIQEKDPSFAYCHVLAHKISFAESEKTPAHWKDILPRCPFTMCNYGCIHGSLIQHYRGEVLTDSQIEKAIEDMRNVCEPREGWEPTEIDRTMCYHALGHLAMYITGGNPDESNATCRKVGVKEDGRDYYEVCVEGVFMTIYQGVDEEDIALVREIKPDKEGVDEFCSSYRGIDYEACNRESYPLFREDIENPDSLSDFCSYSKTEHGRWKCYATAIGDIVVYKLEKDQVDEMEGYCLGAPAERRAQCFANVATRMIQIEPSYLEDAIKVCEMAQRNGLQEECFRDLVAFSSFANKEDSEELSNYCNKLPGDWRQKCLSYKNVW